MVQRSRAVPEEQERVLRAVAGSGRLKVVELSHGRRLHHSAAVTAPFASNATR